jgi:CTP:molybdopterin cytidylyltransferase MocA
MGSPKALLQIGEETFLERLIDVFSDACDKTVVVVGRHAEKIVSGTRNARKAEFIVNEAPERGQAWSLRCGLTAIGAGAKRAFFHPVDVPLVRAETILRMAELETGAWLARPRCDGKRGHPVMAIGEAIAFFREMQEGSTARDVVHSLSDRTVYFDVDDAGILRDVDTPEDYAALMRGDLP